MSFSSPSACLGFLAWALLLPQALAQKPVDPAPPIYVTPPVVVERLKKFIPKTYAKLSERKPVHVVTVGDALVDMTGYGDDAGNQLLAWPARFVDELAQEFFYPGGVRLILPNHGKPDRAVGRMGPDITLRVLATRGGGIQKALPLLSTFGFESVPDLVIVSFGLVESQASADPMLFAKSLREVIDNVRAKGSDILLVGPALTVADPEEASLAATRPFAGMMRDAAAESGIAFADLGDVSSLIRLEADVVTPEQIFGEVAHQYRRFFAWPGVQDFLHPQASLHRKMGALVFKALTEEAKASPWRLTAVGAAFSAADQFTATYDIANTTKEVAKFTLLPLKLPRWLPKDAEAQVELKPGESQRMTIIYQRDDAHSVARHPAFPGHEPLLRLPLLIAGAGFVRVDELPAAIHPLAVMWKLDTLTNQTSTFTLDNVVLNTLGKDIKGAAWEAEWNGQKKSGKLDLAKGASSTLALAFDLPPSPGPRSVEGALTLNVVVDGLSLRWERAISAAQNIGLEKDLSLTALKPSKGAVNLRVDADATSLFLTFDLKKLDLEADAAGTALVAQVSLDARSYGKRLMSGNTEAIQVQTSVGDGAGAVGPIAPWAFGTGYGMGFDSAGVRARLTSSPQGARRLSITLPRSYLYLHEWALGNGNSQLGINARLLLWQGPHDDQKQGSFPAERTFMLTQNGRVRDDAEGLAVLELTDKPTKRWSVVIW